VQPVVVTQPPTAVNVAPPPTPDPNQYISPVNPTPAAAPVAAPAPGVCPECKTMHPSLKPGQKCPNAGVGDQVSDSGLDDAIINKSLVDLRNIIIANLNAKGIKDGNKFLQYSVIELTKALEKYNE